MIDDVVGIGDLAFELNRLPSLNGVAQKGGRLPGIGPFLQSSQRIATISP